MKYSIKYILHPKMLLIVIFCKNIDTMYVCMYVCMYV